MLVKTSELRHVKPLSGYAYSSSSRYPKEPETIMAGESDAENCNCVGYCRIDGLEYLAFRNRLTRRYLFQLAHMHSK